MSAKILANMNKKVRSKYGADTGALQVEFENPFSITDSSDGS